MRTEDGYIVRRALNGEPEAFGLLVDRYKASIYAFAYVKLRNFHDAEDVAQEVFIKAYQKLRELRRYDSFLAWLYSIASGIIITVMSLNLHIALQNPASMPAGSLLSSQAKVLKTGEIPVDILKISQIPSISASQGDGGSGAFVPSGQQNAFFPAPSAEGDTWTMKADMPTARHYFTTSVVDGRIYAIGGWGGERVLPTVEEYDPVKDTWTEKADMPTAREALSASTVNGKIYVIGGWSRENGGGWPLVEEYTPPGWPFNVSSQGKLPTKWSEVK